MPDLPTADELIEQLRAEADPASIEGMARFGINPEGALGVRIPVLRKTAATVRKTAGRGDEAMLARHALAEDLYVSGVHEARILAAFVDDPGLVTTEQMDGWLVDFDSWDVVDQVCANLFDKTPFAYDKAGEWAGREPEFEKRAGFALMAALAWHDKDAPDEAFEPFFGLIEREATDERNFVKKAVNWALRQMGKRSEGLNRQAIDVAERIGEMDSKAARWISRDALKELTSDKVQERLRGG